MHGKGLTFMAKLPPKKEEGNTQEWLNTYADMVTLLLTFFVLLFACSNLDETKLQYIFQAFKSRGRFINQHVTQQDPYAEAEGGTTDSAQPGGEGEMPQNFDELYEFLMDYIEENSLSESMALDQGASHLTIRFDNSVFFDGDSYILKQDGRKLLNDIIPALRAVDPMIHKMKVDGHTAKAPSSMNPLYLSAMRAVSVQDHFANRGTMSAEEKYLVQGYGNSDPIESNNTEEGRSKNRRVEVTLLKNELDLTDPEVIKDILEHDYGLFFENFDPDDQTPDIESLPDGSADKIIGIIKDKFEGTAQNVGSYGPNAVDGSEFLASDSSDSSSSDGGDSEE